MIKTIRKKIKNKDGMTLIEVVVSIALLGILASMVLMVFTTSLLLAINSGDNTNVTGQASAEMNRDILTPTTDNSKSAVVYFKQSTLNASPVINGEFLIVETNSSKNDTTMKAFVPD